MYSNPKRWHERLPRFDDNQVLKLIIYLGVTYILAHFVILLFIVYGNKGKAAEGIIYDVLALPPVYNFSSRWWTLITHAWLHSGFWHWLSNMVWLFMFGSSFQLLTGKQQVIPLYIVSYLSAALVYLLSQWLPISELHIAPQFLMGAQAGVVGMALAVLAVAPRFRYSFSDYFSIPLWAIVLVFMVLMGLSVGYSALGILWLAGGALGGYIYGLLYKKGYRPGSFLILPMQRLSTWFAATDEEEDNPKNQSNPVQRQQTIDALLEKINRKGYHALTTSEREQLERESKKL